MAGRSFRPLSELIDEVQLMLGEPDSLFFTDALVTVFLNQSIDERYIDLLDQHEGWALKTYSQSLVVDQTTYLIPDGVDRVKRVIIVNDDGTEERVLDQDRKISGPFISGTGSGGDPESYRLVDGFVELYPAPSASTGSLSIECEVIPDRLTEDDDRLPASWPPVMETLIVLDTAIACLDAEAAQGVANERGAMLKSQFELRRDRMDRKMTNHTSERAYGRIIGTPFGWGD